MKVINILACQETNNELVRKKLKDLEQEEKELVEKFKENFNGEPDDFVDMYIKDKYCIIDYYYDYDYYFVRGSLRIIFYSHCVELLGYVFIFEFNWK